jgi:HAD superfamily hydrolase (TIGR01509 family)
MKSFKGIYFDLDGVLVDACNWHYEALNKALTSNGYAPINQNDHEKTFNGLPTKIKLKLLNFKEDEIKKINEDKQKYTFDIIKTNAAYMPEKVELHKFLKNNGFKIACVTNSIRETAVEMLNTTGQLEFIDLLVSNEDVLKNKPNPECYNLAINLLNTDPKYSICVEDSLKGIEAAKSSNINFLWTVKNSEEVNLLNFKSFAKDIL